MPKKQQKKTRQEGSNSSKKGQKRGGPPPARGATKVSGKPKHSKITSLADMEERLRGSQFRMINEMLYTTTGSNAYSQFQKDPSLFDAYHHGYAVQVAQWPEDPLDRVIEDVRKEASSHKGGKKPLRVADMGCGVGRLGETLSDGKHIVVHSFDLVASNKNITACNIAHVPLEDKSVDVVVFCLSLMGTDFSDFIKEAWRILVPGGSLKVAEAKSRIESIKGFINGMKELGFDHVSTQDDNKMFIIFEFKKVAAATTTSKKKGGKKPSIKLKPCIYKRR